MADASTRCGFIALIGAPNVGKSTLVNALVGSKVAIVSHKVQTTRALLRGIAAVGNAQLVFIDTPGIFPPRRRLDRAMVATAWTGAREADITRLAVEGFSVLSIAHRLNIAESTVCTHLKRIYRKLGVRSRAELAWRVASGPMRIGPQS